MYALAWLTTIKIKRVKLLNKYLFRFSFIDESIKIKQFGYTSVLHSLLVKKMCYE